MKSRTHTSVNEPSCTLMTHECAAHASDVDSLRSKPGLRMLPHEVEALEGWMQGEGGI